MNAQDSLLYNELTKNGDVERILKHFQSMNHREQDNLVQKSINSHKEHHTTGQNNKSTLIVLAVELGVKYASFIFMFTSYGLHVQHV